MDVYEDAIGHTRLPHPILRKAATELIDKIEKPEWLLDFMITVVAQAHVRIIEGIIKAPKNDFYYLTMITNYIVVPWISVDDDEIVDSVADGLNILYQQDMSEGLSLQHHTF